ncbi:MAG: hypothetical protein M1823_002546 [Watsoniomyces obsoletus]|nr:MAG: hypothetical protein M1823_002546 [Watsoniomyces obsoletus]
MAERVLLHSELTDHLPLLGTGKVRDLYALGDDRLLFVATDRISAYDVVLKNGIPEKGRILTLLSQWWMSVLAEAIPEVETHLISLDLPTAVPEHLRPALQDRCMQVRRLQVFPIEAIVRGYLTGSAWKEYQAKGTVHGIPLPEGMRESQGLPEPLFTPSTKADAGGTDENIHPEEALRIVGEGYGKRIEALSLKLYKTARDHAAKRGIIIADTKFEFGLDSARDEILLIDEVLTPDSSRFWPASHYQVGRPQESFDKQYVRDYLTARGLQGKEGVELPADVVHETSRRYREAFERLVGKTFQQRRGGDESAAELPPLAS